jgi:hypothetical protein
LSVRRTSFGKVERERAKKAKAAAKRELRHARGNDAESTGDEERAPAAETGDSTAELLQQVEDLHRRFDAGVLPYEDFESQKADLMGRIRLD